MDIPETNIHSFIVKIWLEEVADETGKVLWRGHITHVPSGIRRYLTDIDTVTDFILPYLEEMGANPGYIVQLSRWLRRMRRLYRSRT